MPFLRVTLARCASFRSVLQLCAHETARSLPFAHAVLQRSPNVRARQEHCTFKTKAGINAVLFSAKTEDTLLIAGTVRAARRSNPEQRAHCLVSSAWSRRLPFTRLNPTSGSSVDTSTC